jgi:phospholipid transport system transporter-binding protein
VRAKAPRPRGRLEQAGEGRYRLSGVVRLDSAADVLALGVAAFAGQASVEVDLAGVSDADSAGLAVLIEWTRQLRLEGRTITFRSMPPRLAGMARMGGVADLLPKAD